MVWKTGQVERQEENANSVDNGKATFAEVTENMGLFTDYNSELLAQHNQVTGNFFQTLFKNIVGFIVSHSKRPASMVKSFLNDESFKLDSI